MTAEERLADQFAAETAALGWDIAVAFQYSEAEWERLYGNPRMRNISRTKGKSVCRNLQ